MPLLQLLPECRDLLGRIFVVDEQQRISIEGIEAHPWWAGGRAGGQSFRQRMQQGLLISREGAQPGARPSADFCPCLHTSRSEWWWGRAPG